MAEDEGRNLNPVILGTGERVRGVVDFDAAPEGRTPFSAEEIFDLIRDVRDPEHEETTLEALSVARLEHVTVDDAGGSVDVLFTPTIPHCSMATLIGLCLTVKLIRSLPPRFKVGVAIAPGTHASEKEINKQLDDKERVAAALENPHLLKVVDKCIAEDGADFVEGIYDFDHDKLVWDNERRKPRAESVLR
jgi:metal-sulfur cluster biosynthetic enzyme